MTNVILRRYNTCHTKSNYCWIRSTSQKGMMQNMDRYTYHRLSVLLPSVDDTCKRVTCWSESEQVIMSQSLTSWGTSNVLSYWNTNWQFRHFTTDLEPNVLYICCILYAEKLWTLVLYIATEATKHRDVGIVYAACSLRSTEVCGLCCLISVNKST